MAKQRIKREKDFDNGTVTFTDVNSGQQLTVSVADVPESITSHLLVHALNAKVGDAAADPNVDAMEAMTSVWEQLKQGEWSARSGGGGGTRTTVLAEALAACTGKDLEEVKATLDDYSDEDKKELKKHPQIAAKISEIQAERAKAKAKEQAKAAKDAPELNF